MVGAKRLYVTPSMRSEDACCRACIAAGRPERLETLTHAFMDCPAVAPALDWLLRVYEALAGEAPPRDPLVLLAGADWRWRPPVPVLWHRMRVAFLGCVWAARCAMVPQSVQGGLGMDGQPAASDAAAARGVAERVVSTLADGVRRDWRRVVSDVRQDAVGLVPTVWFRGPSPVLPLERFHQWWPAPGGWFEAAAGAQHVVVRLSTTWPVEFAAAA
jgi:hypothetical protein